MSTACTDLFHDSFPVVLNDSKILVWEAKQNRLVYPKITLGLVCKMLIGHEKHGVAFMPKGTGLEGLIVLLHIVDDIADQPFLGTDPVFPTQIGRDLQFYASLREVWLRLGVGRVAKPALFDNSSDSTFSRGQTTSFIDIPERDTLDLLRTPQN